MSSGPTLREAFWVWLKIGLLGFGGPAGQIALLHQETVERRLARFRVDPARAPYSMVAVEALRRADPGYGETLTRRL